MSPSAVLLYGAALGKVDPLVRLDESAWWDLAAQAAREGLEGLLYQRCRTAGIDIPEAVGAALQQSYWTAAEDNFVALQELGAVLGELARDAIEVVVLPGAALLPLYPDPGCRPMDDIDVLVGPGEKSRVEQALRKEGFLSPPRHGDVFVRGKLVLDLHADLLNCGRISSRRHAGWMDPVEVWEERRRAQVEGTSVMTMGVEDAVLYTAVHALRHSFRRLVWFVDLHGLLQPPLDWARLMDKGQRYNLQRPLVYGLRFLRDHLQLDLPAPAQEWLERGVLPPGEAFVLEQAFRDRQRGEWGDLLWSFNVPGGLRRCQFLAETLFPHPAVLLQVFPYLPKSFFPLAYGLRLGQLLLRGGKQLAGLVRRY